MFYYKVTYAYGDTSGRGIPNYPVNNVSDFEPSVDEYRIVGDLRADPIGVTSVQYWQWCCTNNYNYSKYTNSTWFI
jgi:hypothetical protein